MRIVKAGISHRDMPQEHCVKIQHGSQFAHLTLKDAQALFSVLTTLELEADYFCYDLKGNLVQARMREGESEFLINEGCLHPDDMLQVCARERWMNEVFIPQFTNALLRAQLNQADNPL